MVHLSRIYTKFGDGGKTMLGDGSTVPKTSMRVGAYGAVDEANAFLGLAIAACDAAKPIEADLRGTLLAIQQDLFDIGADLCAPPKPDEKPGDRLRVTPEYAKRLEAVIDRHNTRLAPLHTFVLPGGSALAASLHAARTVARRAEREVAFLMESEPGTTGGAALVYLNRLSDLLFVLARVANDDGRSDTLWKPGANR